MARTRALRLLTLLFAGINAVVARHGLADTDRFFDITKWVFATVLPVAAAWVGGVMAYYYRYQVETRATLDHQ